MYYINVFVFMLTSSRLKRKKRDPSYGLGGPAEAGETELEREAAGTWCDFMKIHHDLTFA